MSNELSQFVKESLSKGVSRERIQQALLKGGWETDEIQSALGAYLESDLPVPVPRRRPYLSAREAFMYLVLFLGLYISAFSLGTLLFQFTNLAFPDAIDIVYSSEGPIQAIRNATASLIITFPVFLLMSWLLSRSQATHAEKRGSKIRKWLTYITLFVAAAIVITDLIVLLQGVLAGELTLRFILKVLTVLVISGTIFGYYLWDLRRDEQEK